MPRARSDRATVLWSAFTVSAICRSDFSGFALSSLAIRSRFCSAVRWRRWMFADDTYCGVEVRGR